MNCDICNRIQNNNKLMQIKQYTEDAVRLLSQLIATPSVSRDEKVAADIMQKEMQRLGIETYREANNVRTIIERFFIMMYSLLF